MTMKVPALFSVVVILFASMRTDDVAEAVKCYSCTSSMPNCQKNFFLDVLISQNSGCTCCMKSTSSGTTVRQCVTGLDSFSCAVTTGDSHVCYSDLCNSSTRLQHNGNAASILALLSLATVVLIRY